MERTDRILVNEDPGRWAPQPLTGMLDPVGTTIVYLLDDAPGKKTCEAACSHCWYRTGHATSTGSGTADEIARAKRWRQMLQDQGFTVQLIVPDAFGRDGLYLREGLLDHHCVYDQGPLAEESIAWTSGRPLLHGDPTPLLDLAWERGLRIVAMTVHELGDGVPPIMRGSPTAQEVIEAHRRVRCWPGPAGEQMRTSLTFTLDAAAARRVERLVAAAALLGADYVRLNRFLDFSTRQGSAAAQMSSLDNAALFRTLRQIADDGVGPLVERHRGPLRGTAINPDAEPNLGLQVLISTDFGSRGTEELGLDLSINRCGGGVRLFGLRGDLLYPCGEVFHTAIGRVRELDGELLLEVAPAEALRLQQLHDSADGCIGGLLHDPARGVAQ